MPTIKELQKLIAKKIFPDELAKKVPEKPVVNTFRKEFENILAFVNMIPSPGKEEYFRALKIEDKVIYWKTSENDVGVEIIGVVWDENLNPKIFCGTILPP